MNFRIPHATTLLLSWKHRRKSATSACAQAVDMKILAEPGRDCINTLQVYDTSAFFHLGSMLNLHVTLSTRYTLGKGGRAWASAGARGLHYCSWQKTAPICRRKYWSIHAGSSHFFPLHWWCACMHVRVYSNPCFFESNKLSEVLQCLIPKTSNTCLSSQLSGLDLTLQSLPHRHAHIHVQEHLQTTWKCHDSRFRPVLCLQILSASAQSLPERTLSPLAGLMCLYSNQCGEYAS
jgi:hypothetical protein